ncbi:MAG: 50S ribosomal protein L11 methyltransferase [Mesorhizobium sp.]|nr:50S ribosomal protein L11 methyltransferase [Mesorhizobium sp.]MCO5160132.1 50S ribosomal protein L11 methyltransferase [Mesorhizobium sp.]
MTRAFHHSRNREPYLIRRICPPPCEEKLLISQSVRPLPNAPMGTGLTRHLVTLTSPGASWNGTGLDLNERTPAEIEDFIQSRLSLGPVTGLPGLRLYRQHPRSGLSRFVGENGMRPYWAYGWAGGSALARYILDHPEVVRDRRVVDIGTGSGVVAIAAARAGALDVLAIDVDPLAVVAARLNARANDVTISVQQTDALAGAAPDADLVTVGDLSYEKGLAKLLADFLDRCSATRAGILVGDPGRKHLPTCRLSALARYDVEDFGQSALVPAAVYAFISAPSSVQLV